MVTTVQKIFSLNGLTVFDVEEIPTHGGSLRVYAQKSETGEYPVSPTINDMLSKERDTGITSRELYEGFQVKSEDIKHNLLRFLLKANQEGKKIAAYGAAAKGNTMMNFAGIRPDLVSYVVDKNPNKSGKFMPGSRIPIVDEKKFEEDCPDFVLVLPWNLKTEISDQLSYIRNWNGKFVVAVPELLVW